MPLTRADGRIPPRHRHHEVPRGATLQARGMCDPLPSLCMSHLVGRSCSFGITHDCTRRIQRLIVIVRLAVREVVKEVRQIRTYVRLCVYHKIAGIQIVNEQLFGHVV